MIAHLRGRLFSKSPSQAIIECAGVGYDVAISVNSFTQLPEEGREVELHINTQVREDAIALFGFLDRDEKRLFEKLITVSGIGPTLAIKVLSGIQSPMLVAAIKGQDHATLTKIPGIGKKTAERVVVELKDKLDDMISAAPTDGAAPFHAGPMGDDVLSALTNLGYQRNIAQKAVQTALETNPELRTDFEALFRAAMSAIR